MFWEFRLICFPEKDITYNYVSSLLFSDLVAIPLCIYIERRKDQWLWSIGFLGNWCLDLVKSSAEYLILRDFVIILKLFQLEIFSNIFGKKIVIDMFSHPWMFKKYLLVLLVVINKLLKIIKTIVKIFSLGSERCHFSFLSLWATPYEKVIQKS
jgi:hypothetical protein